MNVKVLFCLLFACVCVARSEKCDAKWGIYGEPTAIQWNDYAWLGGSTHSDKSGDVIHVGQLDGQYVGPFANMGTSDILKVWPLMRTAKYDYGKEWISVDVPNTCASMVRTCTDWEWVVVDVLLGQIDLECAKYATECVLATTYKPSLNPC